MEFGSVVHLCLFMFAFLKRSWKCLLLLHLSPQAPTMSGAEQTLATALVAVRTRSDHDLVQGYDEWHGMTRKIKCLGSMAKLYILYIHIYSYINSSSHIKAHMWIDINRSSSCQAQAENGKESEQHGLVLCKKSYLQMKHREDHHTTKVTSYQIIQISSIFGSSSAMEYSGSMKSYHQLCVSRVHFCHLCLLSLNQFIHQGQLWHLSQNIDLLLPHWAKSAPVDTICWPKASTLLAHWNDGTTTEKHHDMKDYEHFTEVIQSEK